MTGAGRVVYLHVGAPKTGTTYLQDRLALNRRTLAAHGVAYPTVSKREVDHFRPVLDLTGQDFGGPPGHAVGHWKALLDRVRGWPGTVVISHEILSAARPEHVAKALDGLGGSEVHVVFTARDLARQIPSAWQESIKQGRGWTFARYLRRLRNRPDDFFWRSQAIPEVLGRWGADLPPERVHLVTVPPPGAPDGLLLERFCSVVGADPQWLPTVSRRENPSMGIAETALVRQLNRRLHEAGLEREQHALLVKNLLVQQTLVRRAETRRVTLPPRLHPWVTELTEQWAEWARSSGIDVVGDLADLRPVATPRQQWRNPDRPDPAAVVDAALDALTVMTTEAAARRDVPEQVRAATGAVARRLQTSRLAGALARWRR